MKSESPSPAAEPASAAPLSPSKTDDAVTRAFPDGRKGSINQWQCMRHLVTKIKQKRVFNDYVRSRIHVRSESTKEPLGDQTFFLS